MPNIDLILNSSFAVQLHVAAAILAVALTPLAILRKRRDRLHKITGYLWVTSMAVTAISSFWIMGIRVIGPFSPIHLISVWTIYVLYRGVRFAISRNINAHQNEMRSLAFGALGIAGTLSFLPGRRMNLILFGEPSVIGFLVIAALFAFCVLLFGKAKFARRLYRLTKPKRKLQN